MELELSGKRAIICGSSQGLGLGCAVALAKTGLEVTLKGRSEDMLAKTRSDLGSRSPPHRPTERLASYVATLARTGGISKSNATGLRGRGPCGASWRARRVRRDPRFLAGRWGGFISGHNSVIHAGAYHSAL